MKFQNGEQLKITKTTGEISSGHVHNVASHMGEYVYAVLGDDNKQYVVSHEFSDSGVDYFSIAELCTIEVVDENESHMTNESEAYLTNERGE